MTKLFNVAALVTWFCILFGGSVGAANEPETLEGEAKVINGDTIIINNINIRLAGIDAPERGQTCADGWPVAERATERLIIMTRGKKLSCNIHGADRDGMLLGTCWGIVVGTGANAGLRSYNMDMVLQGLAVSYNHDPFYGMLEARARDERNGMWAHNCQLPSAYRRERKR